MNDYSFLTLKIPSQIGLTIFLIISILFLIFFSWHFEKAEKDFIFTEAYFPIIGRERLIKNMGKPIKEVINMEADGEIVHYQKQSFWNEEDFLKILNSDIKFKKMEIESF